MPLDLFLDFINHTVLVAILIFLAIGAITWYIGFPYCQYIYYLSQSGTKQGNEELAKYLAKRTGGRSINVDDSWRSFIPAAIDLHTSFINTKNKH